MHRAGTVAARAFPWAIGVVLASVAVFPVEFGPAAVTLVGLVAGAVLATVGALAAPRPVTNAAAAAAASAVALALVITVRSAFAENPSVSLWGAIGQHAGAGLWLLGAVWLLAGIALADARALRHTLAVVSVAGGAFALATLAEFATGSARGWGSAAGLFENSTSAGEFAAIALVASAAWALSARAPLARGSAIACALACALALAAADSRAGLAGVFAATAFVLLARRASSGRARAALAIGAPVLAIALTEALSAASAGMLGPAAQRALASVVTQRDAIWRSAVFQIKSSPWVGHGAEQFSAWAQWSFDGNAISYNGTYDPHNIVLATLLAGGFLACAVAAVAVAALLRGELDIVAGSRDRLPLSVLASVPVALGGSALFAWVTPAAAVAVCGLAGAMLGAARREPGDAGSPPPIKAVASVAIVAAIAVAVLGMRAVAPERRFLLQRQTLDAATLESSYSAFPDPAYAVVAIDRLSAEPAVNALLDKTAGAATYNVDRALVGLTHAASVVRADDPASKRAVGDALSAATSADPTTGLWFAIAASTAARTGDATGAAAFARLALQDPSSDAPTRAYLQTLASR
jgi:hypothetical protein